MHIFKRLVQRMNKIVKGYSAVSVFERAPYSKITNREKNMTERSVLEMRVYSRANSIKKGLWEMIREKIHMV